MAPLPLTAFASYLAERGADIEDNISQTAANAISSFIDEMQYVAIYIDPSAGVHGGLARRSAYVPARSLTAGILVVFSLLGASIGLLVLWLFVRKGGFIWKDTDWEDYKSSVLRRPGERPDDAITVFSDGSTRRAGGSTQGARTVVLGELDTTYTKSRVPKTFGPRPMASKKKNGMASVWGAGESLWGRLRGGERRSDADTEVAREKEMRQDARSIHTESYVDNQEPARPRGWKPEDSDLSAHYPNMERNQTVVRHPSKSAKRGKSTRKPSTRKAAQPPPPKRVASPQSDYSSSDDSSSESDTDSDDDDDASSIDQSQLGMAKGHKVYAHHLPQETIVAGMNAGPVERNGGGAGGTFGSGVPVGHLVPIGSRAVVPTGHHGQPSSSRGYRKGSEGSLSSVGSMGSSHV